MSILNRKKKKILEILRKKAEEHEPFFKARIVAAVVYKGKIVAIGKNQDKTHPVAAFYSKHKDAIYLHAEVDAIHKAKRIMPDLSGAELYVMRLRQDCSYGMCLPCSGCSRCITESGISNVTYTDDEGIKCISY